MVTHMYLYQKFRNSSLDTSTLGLYCGSDISDSVYTPTGYRILGWTGNAGIHFCQITGFGDAVFAVDPSAPPGDCVHPVAKTLTDFIRLIHDCRSAEIVYRTYQWSRSRFEAAVNAIRPDYKMSSVLRALDNIYHPGPIVDAYSYITQLQQDFDYNSLPLHPDYFEWCPVRPGAPRWDVGMNSAFGDYCDKNDAGTELNVNREFSWQGETWCVPAVYLCENGIVVDSYLMVSPGKLSQYQEKWGTTTALSVEDEMRRQLEDPLKMDAVGKLIVNGKEAPRRPLHSIIWNPATENSWQARRTLEHYGLSREYGYLLRREIFLRKSNNPPIRNMDLLLCAEPVSIPGQRFVAPKNGEFMDFTHPVTGENHTMTILSQTRESLNHNYMSNDPCCYTRLNFTVDPPINRELLSVVDCDEAEGAVNLNTLRSSGKLSGAGHNGVSSLRYTPAEQITWRMIFKLKTRPDMSIPLLP
jgi:hypothetical protein